MQHRTKILIHYYFTAMIVKQLAHNKLHGKKYEDPFICGRHILTFCLKKLKEMECREWHNHR